MAEEETIKQEWHLRSSRPVDGVNTNLKEVVVHNFGQEPVGIRIAEGRTLSPRLEPEKTSPPFTLPGTNVRVEVFYLNGSTEDPTDGLFEFRNLFPRSTAS